MVHEKYMNSAVRRVELKLTQKKVNGGLNGIPERINRSGRQA